jgi:hypothetical protein
MKRLKIRKDDIVGPGLTVFAICFGALFFNMAGYANTISNISGQELTVAFAPFTEEWGKFIAVAVAIALATWLFRTRLPLKNYLEAGFWIGFV